MTQTLEALDYPFVRLVDEAVDDLESLAAVEQLDEDDWVATGHGWLCVLTEETDDALVVTVETWTSAPPPDEDRWDQSRDLTTRFPSGTLWLSGGTDGGSVGEPITLPPSDARSYEARVHVRQQATRSSEPADDASRAQVLVQAWASAAG